MTPQTNDAAARRQFAEDVYRGLAVRHGKWLPAQYFYDDIGSALFEVITLLPEYGLTRADQRLLRTYAGEIVTMLGAVPVLAELGSGSGKKTRYVLEAVLRLEAEQGGSGPVRYSPIDVSAAALASCRASLESLAKVEIHELRLQYLDGLREASAQRASSQHSRQPMLVLFLGSTIGNFAPEPARHFLHEVRQLLQPGDALLLGTDLVKPERQLLLAYDDPLGVTAAFNLNLLSRINRELAANFDLSGFRHEARWSAAEGRVEMHLCATESQTVRIDRLDLDVHFELNESIWTESSHKFTAEGVARLARETGFDCARQWIDSEWPFAESLLLARG